MPIKDPDKNREYQRLWAEKRRQNPELRAKLLLTRKLWRDKNKEKLKECNWYKNREKRNANWSKWKKTEKGRAYTKDYYLRNRDKILVRHGKYKAIKAYGEYAGAYLMYRELQKLLSKEKAYEKK